MAAIKVIIERAEANTAGYDLDTRPICLLSQNPGTAWEQEPWFSQTR